MDTQQLKNELLYDYKNLLGDKDSFRGQIAFLENIIKAYIGCDYLFEENLNRSLKQMGLLFPNSFKETLEEIRKRSYMFEDFLTDEGWEFVKHENGFIPVNLSRGEFYNRYYCLLYDIDELEECKREDEILYYENNNDWELLFNQLESDNEVRREDDYIFYSFSLICLTNLDIIAAMKLLDFHLISIFGSCFWVNYFTSIEDENFLKRIVDVINALNSYKNIPSVQKFS